jgi:hypothetical protein
MDLSPELSSVLFGFAELIALAIGLLALGLGLSIIVENLIYRWMS